jgi:hypothetical protein
MKSLASTIGSSSKPQNVKKLQPQRHFVRVSALTTLICNEPKGGSGFSAF